MYTEARVSERPRRPIMSMTRMRRSEWAARIALRSNGRSIRDSNTDVSSLSDSPATRRRSVRRTLYHSHP